MLVNLAAICVFERARFKDADWSERVENIEIVVTHRSS